MINLNNSNRTLKKNIYLLSGTKKKKVCVAPQLSVFLEHQHPLQAKHPNC